MLIDVNRPSGTLPFAACGTTRRPVAVDGRQRHRQAVVSSGVRSRIATRSRVTKNLPSDPTHADRLIGLAVINPYRAGRMI
jgi:hypothetical protein